MKIEKKEEYLNKLQTNVSIALENLSKEKDIDIQHYMPIQHIILDCASLSFDEGFNCARLFLAIECVNKIAEIFNNE